MPAVAKSQLVGYPAAAMFDLVNDIESYPQFLPLCRSARVLRRDRDQIDATIEMAKGGIRKSFTTRNRLRPHRTIELELLHGPFRRLEGLWRFEPLDEASCRVSLKLEFEFSSRLLALSLGPLFAQLGNSMVDAFCQRARALHG